MNERLSRESNYCDLVAGKICDNCCKCLDVEEPYAELEVYLHSSDYLGEIQDPDLIALSFEDVLQKEYSEDEAMDADESFDASHVAPIEIDPALRAEWERKLRDYELQQKEAYMRTLHGARKRPAR